MSVDGLLLKSISLRSLKPLIWVTIIVSASISVVIILLIVAFSEDKSVVETFVDSTSSEENSVNA